MAVAVNQVNFGSRSTSTGPQAYDIRTSLDGFATAAASGALSNNSAWDLMSNVLSLAGAQGQAITFRIYAYNGAGNASKNTANWRIDDLSVTVATSGSIPQPTITVSPSSLPPFSATAGGASGTQSLTVITAGSIATTKLLVI